MGEMTIPLQFASLLEVYEDMVEVLLVLVLVLKIFLTEDSWVDYLLGGAPPCSEACLFFAMIFSACGSNLFCMISV